MENSKIKICYVASADITIKFLLLSEIIFLKNRGYEASAVCSLGKWKKSIEEKGVKLKNIKITRNITPFSDLAALLRLFFYFKKEKFDIVHTHTPKPGLIGQLAAKLAGVPIIVNTIHGFYFINSKSYFKKKFFIFLEKIAGKCSDLVIFKSKEDFDFAISQKIIPLQKAAVVHNGIDLQRFNPEKFSGEFILNKKKELNIPLDFCVIGTVGRLVQEKGYIDLFKAIEKVSAKFPKILLLAIGPEDPEKKDSLKLEMIKNYGIKENILFLGERTDMPELYSIMDIFVLASHREGFPVSVLEAMAMGKTVIATDIRGCREEIDNTENGILIPSKNPPKITEALIYVLENPDKAKQMAESARRKAVTQFDEGAVFDRIKEEYDRLKSQKTWRFNQLP